MVWPFGKKPENSVTNRTDSWEVLRGLADPFRQKTINEKTAMQVSAVYACVRLIAGAISTLPCQIYKNQGGDRQRIDHDYWWLLNERANPAWSAATFWEFCTIQFLLRGDAISYIQRDRSGKIIGFFPVSRDCVRIEKKSPIDPRESYRLQYYFSIGGKVFGADQDDVLHFAGFGFNGEHSYSVIEWGARQATTIASAADEHAKSHFESGGQPHLVVKTAGKMGEEQQKAFIAAWNRKYGGAKINGTPLILTEGLGIEELAISAKDSQLLESRQWQVIDIARAFGVPPFMIGETTSSTSWGSGIEQMTIAFRIYTTGPHIERIQQELNAKLFQRAGNFVEFDQRGIMTSDHKSRAEYYKAALGGTQNPAWMTPNEVRKLENLPQLPEFDRPMAQPAEPETTKK